MKKIRKRVAEQTLKLLLSFEWELISIDLICKRLKIDKKTISRFIKNKHDILININQFFDSQVLISLKSIEHSTSRDMLFEIFMIRFDVLSKYRKSVLNIFKIFKKQPNYFIFLLPYFITSISIMAKHANINIKGINGSMMIKGMLIIYFSTFLIWAKDESTSLDKTMISLDKYLKRAEIFLKLVK